MCVCVQITCKLRRVVRIYHSAFGRPRGFDVENIASRSRPVDIRRHEVLGKTYRVRIMAVGEQGRRGQKRSSDNSAAHTLPKSSKALEDGPPEDADANKSTTSSDSSSSSSSDSDSSSSSKKRRSKKDKKGKKSKKSKKDAKKKKKDKKEKSRRNRRTKKRRKQNGRSKRRKRQRLPRK